MRKKKKKSENTNASSDLTVQKVKEQTITRNQPSKRLPQFPFFWIVIAPRKSGKTNMVVDALLDENKYCGRFDVIIICSRTFHHDSKWRNLTLPSGSVFTSFEPSEFEKILEAAEEVSKSTYVNILVVVDDMISDSIMTPRKMGVFEALAIRGRHANISVIMITQQYMALSPSVRNNATNTTIFRIRNGQELERITRENRESLSSGDFLKVYNIATNKPYAFLHINNQESDPKLRFSQNWNNPIRLDNVSTTEKESKNVPPSTGD